VGAIIASLVGELTVFGKVAEAANIPTLGLVNITNSHMRFKRKRINQYAQMRTLIHIPGDCKTRGGELCFERP
jgi:hypothetical protein